MKYAHFSPFRLFLIAVSALLIGKGEVQAKGFKLITTGDSVDVLGSARPEVLAHYGPGAMAFNKVGYKYDYFGLFWLDIWNWGGSYALTDGSKYATPVLTDKEAAELLGTSTDKLTKPLNYRFPYGLDILIVLGILKFLPRMMARKKAAAQTYSPSTTPAWTPPTQPTAGTPPPLPPDEK